MSESRGMNSGMDGFDEKPTKHTADIANASFIHMHDGWHMMGRISNHDRQSDFHSPVQMTSKLLRIDFENNTAETLNTHYRLV